MKPPERARGLYKNGNLWWMRVRKTPVSTGTSDLVTANRIAGMVAELEEGTAAMQEWLDRAARKDVTLLDLYQARAAGTLTQLAARLKEAGAAEADADLDPLVDKWDAEHLAMLVASNQLSEPVRQNYRKQVRALIPEGVRFPASKLTEDYIKKALQRLATGRSGKPLTGSTRRRYFVAWKLFYRWAKKRVTFGANPFEDASEWVPANNSPRAIFWDHETTLDVLGRMTGEERIAMALIFGTGGELGTGDASGVLKMKGRHVGKSDVDRMVTIPGSKNAFREDRQVFVDAWAWPIIRAHADTRKPHESLWSTLDVDGEGDEVREAFYGAQVAAGLVEDAPRSELNGKRLWGQVEGLHKIHDARHTYCYVRLLGDDGEPRQDLKFCAAQLGHADEQMVMKIYGKLNLGQRIKLAELREARKGGRE